MFKQLEWEIVLGKNGEVLCYNAKSLLNTIYTIWPDGHRNYVDLVFQGCRNSKGIANKGSLDQAKQAAQEHHDQIIGERIDIDKIVHLLADAMWYGEKEGKDLDRTKTKEWIKSQGNIFSKWIEDNA